MKTINGIAYHFSSFKLSHVKLQGVVKTWHVLANGNRDLTTVIIVNTRQGIDLGHYSNNRQL